MAKACSYDATGFELSEPKINFAKRMGLNIISDISKIPDNTYDYISSYNVFEHISDPLECVKELKRVLAKNGLLHIRVPQGIHTEKKVLQSNWQPLNDEIHPLEHINSFKRITLQKLADKAGLKVVSQLKIARYERLEQILRNPFRYFYNLKISTSIHFQKI